MNAARPSRPPAPGPALRRDCEGKSVAIPLTGEAARPSFGSLIPAQFTFRGMHLKKRRSAAEIQGAAGTCLIPGADASSAPRVKAVLDFVGIAKRTLARDWPAQVAQVFKS